jgi:hypothetical protein
MNKYLTCFFLLFLLIGFWGCDKGIEPGEPKGPGGFSGKVTFVGSWPTGVARTHLVVFKNPIQSSDDFFPPNLTFVADSIPYKASSFEYNSFENNFIPIFQLGYGQFKYVVVAQSKTVNISLDRKDWYVVGVYCINNEQSKPATLIVEPNKITPNINIVVDFNNPPPQPPM